MATQVELHIVMPFELSDSHGESARILYILKAPPLQIMYLSYWFTTRMPLAKPTLGYASMKLELR